MLSDIASQYASSNPLGLTAIGGGRAVFSANDASHGTELWVTNGTSAGTQLVKDIGTGVGDGLTSWVFGGKAKALDDGQSVFLANDGTTGEELDHQRQHKWHPLAERYQPLWRRRGIHACQPGQRALCLHGL